MDKWTSQDLSLDQIVQRMQDFRKTFRVPPFVYYSGKVKDYLDSEEEYNFPGRVQLLEVSATDNAIALQIVVDDELVAWYVQPIKPYTFELTDTEIIDNVYEIPPEIWPEWIDNFRQQKREQKEMIEKEERMMQLAIEAKDVSEILRYLDFDEKLDASDQADLVKYFVQKPTCGVYVLHFGNTQYYVGQTVNIVRRISDHRRNHHDIETVSFKPLSKKYLDRSESDIIWLLEDKGFYLRNIDMTSILSNEPSNFDKDVMTPADQKKWLSDLSYIDLSGKRDSDAKRQKLYIERYEDYKELPYAKEITDVLRGYVQNSMPGILRGEASYWAVSCLPPPPYDVMIRVNVNWQEVFLANVVDGYPWSYLCISRRELQKTFGDSLNGLTKKYPSLTWSVTRYKAGGADQVTVEITDLETATAFINDQSVIRAARLYNLRLMKKGRCPWRKSHNFALVDEILQ